MRPWEAAIIAGASAGIFRDIREGVSQMVTADQQYEPILENVKLYDELYDVFCRMYEALDEKVCFVPWQKSRNAKNIAKSRERRSAQGEDTGNLKLETRNSKSQVPVSSV